MHYSNYNLYEYCYNIYVDFSISNEFKKLQ